MKTRKTLALLLVLALMVSLLSMSAFATTTLLVGSGVNGISISGAGIYDVSSSSASIVTSYDNYRYINNIVLPSGTSDTATITITFDPASNTVISPIPPQGVPAQFLPRVVGNATNTYTVTLSDGVGSVTVYAHHDLAMTHWQDCDIYVFNFSKGNYNNPVDTTNGLRLRLGDPLYELTAPECYMEFVGSGNAYTVRYNGPLGDSSLSNYTYYPDTLAFYIDGATGITAMTGTNITITTYNDDYTVMETGNSLTSTAALNRGFYALYLAAGQSTYTLTITKGGTNATLTFKQPKAYATTGGTAPTSVVSYLPIGQFATGSGWGNSGGKFTGGYSSTGVSLGALGGYIEFYFANGITNDPRNPYGIDLVVYGNAFAGNPEAGSVQVSENGTEWYELAGSLYYEATPASVTSTSGFHSAYTGTLRNADVTYTLGSSINTSATNGTVTLAANPFTSNTAWWPTTTEYSEFSNYATDPNGNAHTDSNVTVNYGSSTLTYGGVTAVQDSDTTAYYAFGYADVTPNGSPSTYGDAINPYIAYSTSKVGGDGFDLEWAVNIGTGLPVDVSGKTFKYVRVYSAVLDNGTFGETSTEVCGIFSAYRTDVENALDEDVGVGRTTKPTSVVFTVSGVSGNRTISGNLIPSSGGTIARMAQIMTLVGSATKVNVTINATSGANVYINNIRLEETSSGVFTGEIDAPTSTQQLRVITQYDNQAPHLFVIN